MTNGPLTDEDLERINKALDDMRDLEQQIEQATRAGLDVTSQRDALRRSREQALKLKQTFFAGRS